MLFAGGKGEEIKMFENNPLDDETPHYAMADRFTDFKDYIL